ncbi:MAG: arsenate reductase (thioredoxin), partial [Deltaproteobacteria bacterium]|nr:arsenate reductase (thioredoxin) [Deltaproteobacteria bacterium]
QAHSAGIEAHGLNPRAVQVMQEDGIDISSQKSKVIDPQLVKKADYLITLCGDAQDRCPAVLNPQAKKIHWDLADPAQAKGSEEAIQQVFRKTREDIKKRILDLKTQLKTK